MFLDRLIQFNEERGSALTQCPTISKHPLDLFRLYMAVKEKNGFLDVGISIASYVDLNNDGAVSVSSVIFARLFR